MKHSQLRKERKHFILFCLLIAVFMTATYLDNQDLPQRNQAYQCEIRSEFCNNDRYSREHGYRRQ